MKDKLWNTHESKIQMMMPEPPYRHENEALRAIADDITKAFIHKEYMEKFGVVQMTPSFNEDALRAYWHEPFFATRIKGLVAGVMNIIEKHLDKYEPRGYTMKDKHWRRR